MKSIAGTWSSVSEDGQATGLNLISLANVDCTEVRDLTRAEIDGRAQALLAVEALRRYLPGFENARLRNFGMTLGTRDSRKISGRYTLTGDDVRSQARFDDSIGIFPEFIDGYGVLILPTTGRYFQVPYGILVPRGVEEPARRGALRGRRQSFARRDSQPDVLCGHRAGRRRGRRGLAQGRHDQFPGRHSSPAAGAAEAGGASLLRAPGGAQTSSAGSSPGYATARSPSAAGMLSTGAVT